jgi:Endonuclease/Exonuclease/phosphatase family
VAIVSRPSQVRSRQPFRGVFRSACLALGAALAAASWAAGQSVTIGAFDSAYEQNFDSLAASGSANPWTDGSTLAGWYAYHTNGREGEPVGAPTIYRASDGTDYTGSVYSFGSAGSGDRALGSIGSNSYGDIYYAVRLVNGTGGEISTLDIAYTGEQWRSGGNTDPHKLSFSYLVSAAGGVTDITAGSWTSFDLLDFTSPVYGGDAMPLDGNAFSYRTSLSATVSLNVAPGQEIWLRWRDTNDRGNDHALAIDDLSVTAHSSGPPSRAIHDIQGAGTTSPFAGDAVATQGVVTAVRHDGFYLQAPDAEADDDPDTSEGVFVYTGATPPSAAAVGNLVEVTGTVSEYVPAADPDSPSLTEISQSPSVKLVSQGEDLPAAVTLTAADTDPSGSLEELERYEGMRVAVPPLRVVGATLGSLDESAATSTSNGVFYGVIDGIQRPFREAGIAAPDPLPLPGIPRFDGNPERLRVDSDALVDAVPLDVAAGSLVSGLVGPLDYAYRTWTVLPEPSSEPVVSEEPTVTPLPAASLGEIVVATWNLQRFFDDEDDPSVGEAVLTPAAFDMRLAKASLAIRNVLGSPDILAVEEVENLAALSALADRIDADAVAAGGSDPSYQAYLEEGNDPSGIDVGFLVKSTRVDVVAVTQEGKGTIFSFDGTLLNDRPPLLLQAVAHPGVGSAFPLTVIVNHLRSLTDIEDSGKGPRVRAKRQEQAEYLAQLVQQRQLSDPGERILCLGDFNAFQFNDGYVDVMGTVRGDPTPADEVLLASPDLVDPDLVDLVDEVPAAQRYTYVLDGNAEVLDHVLATSNLTAQVKRVAIAHFDVDFPAVLRGDASSPVQTSDHDPVVVVLGAPDRFPPRPPRRRLSH